MTDLAQLVSDLQTDEGWVGYLYDDANGEKIGPGTTVKGNPTAAWGFALNVAPLTQQEALPILNSRTAAVVSNLISALPWIAALSEPRQRALCNCAYNLGVAGLETFTTFLGMVQSGDFEGAADDLLQTKWASQVGERAQRIAALIRNG